MKFPELTGVRGTIAGFAAGAVLFTGLGLAVAQAPPPPPMQGGPGGPMMHRGMEEHRCEDFDARQAGMLAYAQVKLGITDAQKTAWSQFEERVKAAGAPIRKLCTDSHGHPMPASLPDRLAHLDELSTARASQMHGVREAVDQLYPQLTADQKQIADHVLEEHHGEHGRPGWSDHKPPPPGAGPGQPHP